MFVTGLVNLYTRDIEAGWRASSMRSVCCGIPPSSKMRRFDPLDGVDTGQRPVEGCDLSYTGALGTRDEVGFREGDHFGLVQLNCPQEERRINAHDRVERQQ
jgi:hypothetical protein